VWLSVPLTTDKKGHSSSIPGRRFRSENVKIASCFRVSFTRDLGLLDANNVQLHGFGFLGHCLEIVGRRPVARSDINGGNPAMPLFGWFRTSGSVVVVVDDVW
jgi:hypothetical protein